jgi:hypothetical protein
MTPLQSIWASQRRLRIAEENIQFSFFRRQFVGSSGAGRQVGKIKFQPMKVILSCNLLQGINGIHGLGLGSGGHVDFGIVFKQGLESVYDLIEPAPYTFQSQSPCFHQ